MAKQDPQKVNEEILKNNPDQTNAPYQVKQGQEPIPNPDLDMEADKAKK